MKIKKGFDSVQGLIGEYEYKCDKPTLEGFSNFIERRKQYAIRAYEEFRQLRENKQ